MAGSTFTRRKNDGNTASHPVFMPLRGTTLECKIYNSNKLQSKITILQSQITILKNNELIF
jgi:hypothetical protein